MNVVVAPAGKVAVVQETSPPELTAGVVHGMAGPGPCEIETNVIVPGRRSSSSTVEPSSGPALLTVIV